jgi:uncharacterized protein (TIGR00299 family) protein
MRTLYLDCSAGVSGDMMLGALCGLLDDPHELEGMMKDAGIPHVDVRIEKASVSSVSGNRVRVLVHGEEEHQNDGRHGHHGTQGSKESVISGLNVSETVKKHALEIYGSIASAEAEVHGRPVDEVHFHEVGAMDAVADVTAVCWLMEALAPERVAASPVHVGSGTVRCAHGILPVPAPATAYILRDVPIYGGNVRGELCTPTGAALLRRFVTRFGEMPVMRVETVGYGMGKKDFEAANCVRAMLGETEGERDTVVSLSCNVDDMTAEELGFAIEELLAAGALEAYCVPAAMKKSRPGAVLRVLCRESGREALVRQIFRLTSTIGVRESVMRRYVLERETVSEDTEFGPVRKKLSRGYGVVREKFEYDDLARIARETGLPLSEVKARLGAK